MPVLFLGLCGCGPPHIIYEFIKRFSQVPEAPSISFDPPAAVPNVMLSFRSGSLFFRASSGSLAASVSQAPGELSKDQGIQTRGYTPRA